MEDLVKQLHAHDSQNMGQSIKCSRTHPDESEGAQDTWDTDEQEECIHPPEPPQLSDNDVFYGSLETVVREAPYHITALLDLGCLQALAQARKTEAEDHIWLLREDPGYFTETVSDAKDHRPETLYGEHCGQMHKNGRKNILLPRLLERVATDAYMNFSIWHEIHQRIPDLHMLSARYGDVIAETKNLPHDFFDLLVET